MSSPKKLFFGRSIPILGNIAVVVLCLVFFWVPFAMRGARMAVGDMKNDFKDWLPSDFEETKELNWFRDHFLGESFVVATWPGCNEGNDEYKLLRKKLALEVAPPEELAAALANEPYLAPSAEDLKLAGEVADQLLLHYTPGDYGDYENYGRLNEKWLKGDGDFWYYILPNGELYRWNGANNMLGAASRTFKRNVLNEHSIEGELVATLGPPAVLNANGEIVPGRDNPFHANPRLLRARHYKSITTGPEILDQLAGKNGPLWPRGPEYAGMPEIDKRTIARRKAYQRLEGTLFGPQPPPDFEWTADSLDKIVSPGWFNQLPLGWRATFAAFVKDAADEHTAGDIAALNKISRDQQRKLWFDLWDKLDQASPPPQTCFIVTMSDIGRENLGLVVGRQLMGKPTGAFRDLAIDQCGIPASALKLGGPPVDNVAIDEEGTITLGRLVIWSTIVGFLLAYISFRSVRLTIMVFFVGGVSAAASLGIVWWLGGRADAILMSMPALVYVLGLSGAVHIVNYYRDAAREGGHVGAPEKAVAHGWFPCLLAAFTTALGLGSLYASNIIPIQKFGLFSALGTLATVTLLFTYLPAALQLWAPEQEKKKREPGKILQLVDRFWKWVCDFIIRHNTKVAIGSLLVMVAVGFGLTRIKTSVQLLKLFDEDAKVIHDYTWMEANLGRLVPMEIILRTDKESLRPQAVALADQTNRDSTKEEMQFDFLDRLQLVKRVQREVEAEFGDDGQQVLGRGMSPVTFTPELPGSGAAYTMRGALNRNLEASYDEFIAADYLRVEKESGDELLRISLRLGALNDVDYGEFVKELKEIVEPVLAAYRCHDEVLTTLYANGETRNSRVLVLGAMPISHEDATEPTSEETDEVIIDQTAIFARTLHYVLRDRGFRTKYAGRRTPKQSIQWVDPAHSDFEKPAGEKWEKILGQYDIVVLANERDTFNADTIRKFAPNFVDARDHTFSPSDPNDLTAAKLAKAGDQHTKISAIYTGVIPIVYKAQRTLLRSLIDSIALAFVTIALVMMVLLRDWKTFSFGGLINFRGGLLSMLPNVFPVVIIFGAMGHLGILVDIGSMMTASVAMGVAVDDTIHFLNWYRTGLNQGKTRIESIRLAYDHVATAMTQTTAIGGLGLAVFALSTFTPTQRFGLLMLSLLVCALVGDLIFLPALLAGPLGKYFGKEQPQDKNQDASNQADSEIESPNVHDLGTDNSPLPTADSNGSPNVDKPKSTLRGPHKKPSAQREDA